MEFHIEPGGRLTGQIRVPGDKSISHRALLLGAIAEGRTTVAGFLESEDCLATLAAVRALGARVEREGECWQIEGTGASSLTAPDASLDLGNSGTSMRLLVGVLAGQSFASHVTGDASLYRRPMDRVIEPLTQMGAAIQSDEGCAPLTVHGQRPLTAIDYTPPVASAQIKSCVLLAGLFADGRTTVREVGVSRDHTERMLSSFGVPVTRFEAGVSIIGGSPLYGTDVVVPTDLSSAAFFLVGAAIAPDSALWLSEVGINPTRRGVLDCLARMGAVIEYHNERELAGEPVADLHIRGGDLSAIDIGAVDVALAIDELPALCIAAACARGTTQITGAAELRVKESDRIAVVAGGLAALGVDVTIQSDGMTITGTDAADAFAGGRIATHGDHRIAMAFAMAALRASAPIVIDDCAPVATSFPGFETLAAEAGLAIARQ
ncbi:3-phosphoshikimate 1-carboxyvinyltransferase [Salinisphaera sp. USBA-960]|nr:3-phosphoshikimate 1-carboxyvinyltransferase [Salifodinibacter halophilus]NNC26387.1 3-phosphoshikimate 1-carboxyvinyltransferase [Salifodinibacter halophilus]